MARNNGSIIVTPVDAVDCNQLVSLLDGTKNFTGTVPFKIGQTCIVWLVEGQPCYASIAYPKTLEMARESKYTDVLTVNELAQRLNQL